MICAMSEMVLFMYILTRMFSPAGLQARKRGSCRCRWVQKRRYLGFARVSAALWPLCLEPPGPVERHPRGTRSMSRGQVFMDQQAVTHRGKHRRFEMGKPTAELPFRHKLECHKKMSQCKRLLLQEKYNMWAWQHTIKK